MRPPRDYTKGPDHDVESREDVTQLVQWFYQAAIPDELLGPVFEAVGVDWDVHIPKLVEFWLKQIFGEGDYQGNVVVAHTAFEEVQPFTQVHVDRWLELFDETVDELFVGMNADRAKVRAHEIGELLKTTVARRHIEEHKGHRTLPIVP